MTVLDTSGAIDYLLGDGAAAQVEALLAQTGPAAAPALLVFELLAVLRRMVLRGELSERRALAAVDDLGDLAVELFPTLPLRGAAFDLRHISPPPMRCSSRSPGCSASRSPPRTGGWLTPRASTPASPWCSSTSGKTMAERGNVCSRGAFS